MSLDIYAIPIINNMLDVLSISSKTRWAVKCTIAYIATKNGGVDTIFM